MANCAQQRSGKDIVAQMMLATSLVNPFQNIEGALMKRIDIVMYHDIDLMNRS